MKMCKAEKKLYVSNYGYVSIVFKTYYYSVNPTISATAIKKGSTPKWTVYISIQATIQAKISKISVCLFLVIPASLTFPILFY